MGKVETIEEFYKQKFDWIPDNLRKEIGNTAKFDQQPIKASTRISSLFLGLLQRQFPIDENHQSLQFRSASDFAMQLKVHVNHLNRAVKKQLTRRHRRSLPKEFYRKQEFC